MSRELALRIIKLLAGLTALSFSKESGIPDYLFDEMFSVTEEVEKTILEDKP